MQIYDKINPDLISIERFFDEFLPSLKNKFQGLLPIAVWTFGVGFILLILQAFFIGLADRLGVSPKISFVVSSLFYAITFGSLVILGKSKIIEKTKPIKEHFSLDKKAEAICKLLIIKRVNHSINK
jgi:hypothetical protein